MHKLESEDRACLEDYLEHLKNKATVFKDINKNILDTLEDERDYEVESEGMHKGLQ